MLDENRIPYDYRVEQRRGIVGHSTLSTYEIYVRAKDYEEAVYLLRKS